MSDILKDRALLYDSIRKNCNVVQDHGIVVVIEIPEAKKLQLKEAYSEYLHSCLLSHYGKRNFLCDWRFKKADFSFLKLYKNEIMNLPNITPGGVITVKKENQKQFNKMQSIMSDILIETGLIEHFSHIQYINPRIVDGGHSTNRPLDPTKYHSDVWASQKGDAVLSIPIAGDETTTVEFCKPMGITEKFFTGLTDYDNASKNKFFDYLEFIGFSKFEKINLFDVTCVHRSIKQGGGLRVSLDLCVALKNKSSFFSENNKLVYEKYRTDYIQSSEYTKLGKELFICPQESMSESEKYITNKDQKNRKYGKVTIKYNGESK